MRSRIRHTTGRVIKDGEAGIHECAAHANGYA